MTELRSESERRLKDILKGKKRLPEENKGISADLSCLIFIAFPGTAQRIIFYDLALFFFF